MLLLKNKLLCRLTVFSVSFIMAVSSAPFTAFSAENNGSAESGENVEQTETSAATFTELGLGDISEKPDGYKDVGNPYGYGYTNLNPVRELSIFLPGTDRQSGSKEVYDKSRDSAKAENETLLMMPFKATGAKIDSFIKGSTRVKSVGLNLDKNNRYAEDTEACLYLVPQDSRDAAVKAVLTVKGKEIASYNVLPSIIEKDPGMLEHYYQLVKGDFDGDGADDIALYVPEVAGDKIKTNIHVIYLDANGSKKSEAAIDFGTGDNKPESLKTIGLSAGNLTGGFSDELVAVQGWEYLNPLPPSTVYVYSDMLKGTAPVFSKELKEQINGKSFYVNNASATIGDVTGDGLNKLVIVGFMYDNPSKPYWVNTYLAYYGYDVNSNTFSLGVKNSEDFHHISIIRGHWSGYEVNALSQIYQPPIALATARLRGPGKAESIFADGIIFTIKPDGSGFDEDRRIPETYDAFNYFGKKKPKDDEYKEYRYITQVVAGNFNNNPFGVEQFAYVHYMQASKNYQTSIRMVSPKFGNSATKTLPQAKYDMDIRLMSSTVSQQYASISNPDLDGVDGSVAKYLGTALAYTKPQIIAVLAAPPYFAEIAELEPGYSAGGGTTYGKSHSAGVGLSAHISYFSSFSIGYKATADFFGLGETGMEASLSTGFGFDLKGSLGAEIKKDVTFTNKTGKDQVVVMTVPVEQAYYEILIPERTATKEFLASPDLPEEYKNLKEGDVIPATTDLMSISFPYDARVVLIPADTYNEVAKKTKGFTVLGKDILKHTVGLPETYKDTHDVKGATGFSIGTYRSLSDEPYDVTYSFDANIGAGLDFNDTTTLDASVSVLGASMGNSQVLTYGAGINGVFHKGASMSGNPPQIEEKYVGQGYNGQWRLSAFAVPDIHSSTFGALLPLFPVITYETKDVKSPVKPPRNFKVMQTASNTVTLEWVHPYNADVPSGFPALPGVVEFQGYELQRRMKGNTDFQIVEFIVDGKIESIIDKNAISFIDNSDTIQDGHIYEYRLRTVSSKSEERYSIFTPIVSSITQYDGPSPEFTVKPQDAHVKVGEDAVFTIDYKLGRQDSDVRLDWQVSDERKGWVTLAKDKKTLTVKNVTAAQNGQTYRCVLIETKNDIRAELFSDEVSIIIENDTPKVYMSGIPEWASPYVQRAIGLGYLTIDENGALVLPDTVTREFLLSVVESVISQKLDINFSVAQLPEGLTRQEMAHILAEALRKSGNITPETEITLPDVEDIYDDFEEIDPAYSDDISALNQLGILVGTPDGEFNPTDIVTTPEAAVAVINLGDCIDSNNEGASVTDNSGGSAD